VHQIDLFTRLYRDVPSSKYKIQQLNDYVNKINFQNINNSLIKIFSVIKSLATALPTYTWLHLEHRYPRPVITCQII